MQKSEKYKLLEHVPNKFTTEKEVNKSRIFEYNRERPNNNGIIVYLCEREIRAKDNFALQFGLQEAERLKKKFKIIHPEITYDHRPKDNFIKNQLLQTKHDFDTAGLDFEIICKCKLEEYLKSLDISILITDFNPLSNKYRLSDMGFKLYEIDGHNIIPARFISSKPEYNAFTLRKKIYSDIYPFMNEFDNIINTTNEADIVLKNFIKNKLNYYSDYKNDPIKDVTSKLSQYLNLGFISSQRVALEVIKSDTDLINKETFLEELIVRKELADNYCLYNNQFKTLNGIPFWAKTSLKNHLNDLREYIYSTEELERGITHDKLWNACQKQLLKEGRIHGYLRMYWAKKIQEWSLYPEEAQDTLIYLNDRYSYDAPSPSGYVGILWSIAGVHDRAFKDWQITGKIRRMTYNSLKTKFDTNKYISKYL